MFENCQYDSVTSLKAMIYSSTESNNFLLSLSSLVHVCLSVLEVEVMSSSDTKVSQKEMETQSIHQPTKERAKVE